MNFREYLEQQMVNSDDVRVRNFVTRLKSDLTYNQERFVDGNNANKPNYYPLVRYEHLGDHLWDWIDRMVVHGFDFYHLYFLIRLFFTYKPGEEKNHKQCKELINLMKQHFGQPVIRNNRSFAKLTGLMHD